MKWGKINFVKPKKLVLSFSHLLEYAAGPRMCRKRFQRLGGQWPGGMKENVKDIKGCSGCRKGCSERKEMWGGQGDPAVSGNDGECQETPRNECAQHCAHPNITTSPGWCDWLPQALHATLLGFPVCQARPEEKETCQGSAMAAVAGQGGDRRRKRWQRERISVLIHGDCAWPAPAPSLLWHCQHLSWAHSGLAMLRCPVGMAWNVCSPILPVSLQCHSGDVTKWGHPAKGPFLPPSFHHLVPFSTGLSCLSSTTLPPSCAFQHRPFLPLLHHPAAILCLFHTGPSCCCSTTPLPFVSFPSPQSVSQANADLRPSGYPTYHAPGRSCVRQSRPFAANCTHVLLGSFASLSECLCSAVRWRAGEAGDIGTTTGSPKQPGALCYQPNTATWKKPLLWALWLHGMEWWNDGEWWRYMKGHPEVLRGHVSSHFSAGNTKPPQKQPGQELLCVSCFEISLSAFKSLGQHLEIRLDFCLDSISHIFYWDSYLSKLL